MRRTLLFLGLVTTTVVWAQAESRASDYFRRFGRQMVTSVEALFEFLPASGAGAPVAKDLCDAITPDDVSGSWWCLSGAGTSTDADGGVVLSAVGSPATQTRPLCSNGLTCADATAQRTDGVDDGYKTGNRAGPTGDFSVCWLGFVDSAAGAYAELMAHDVDAPANNRSWTLDLNAGGNTVPYFTVFAASGSSNDPGAALSLRAWHLVCGVYDYVGDGTSVITTYVDGTSAGANSAAKGPAREASSTFDSVNYRAYTGAQGWLPGAFRGAFFTEKVLSAADVARLSAAVHGTLTGSRGEAVTFTRTSAQTCDSGGGAVTVLPADRPCVAQGGYLSEGSATNLWLRSEEFATYWTLVGTPIITSNTTTSPDGTTTADTIEDDTAAASEAVYQAPATTAGQPYTASVWAKAGTQSAMTMYNDDTVCVKALTSDWVRYTCTDPSASGAAVGTQLNVGDDNADTGTIVVWGAQFELGSSASSYIRTEGSTATRVATKLTGTKPTAVGDGQGCMAATVKVPGVTAGARVLDWNAGYSYLQSTTVGRSYDSTNTISATAGSSVVDRYVRLVTTWTGSTLTATHDGVAASGSYDGALTGASFFIGSTTTPDNHLNGFVKQVEVDSSLTRCDQ